MATSLSSLQQLYLAYFNRPADSAGLAYWTTALGNGGTLNEIAAAFSRSAEYKMAFLQMTPHEIVDTIYQNLFGRAAEPAGRQYWAERLINGEARIDTVVRSIADGARGADQASIDAKVRVAAAFTAALDTPEENAAYNGALAALAARDLLAEVRSDSEATSTIARLDAIMAQFSATGQRLTLTPGTDAITGTGTNDTFAAPVGSLQSGDTLLGGAGVADRLEAVIAAAGASPLALSMRDVEVAELRAVRGASGSDSLTIDARTDGVRRWVSDASEVSLTINGAGLDARTVNRDIGIVMRDTVAGNVDFSVYFDQVRHARRLDDVLFLSLASNDDPASATPLRNAPYVGVGFFYNDKLVELRTSAIDTAETFDQLYLAIKQAVADHPALGGVTVTQSEPFTYTTSRGEAGTARGVNLASSTGVLAATGPGAGWFAAKDVVPTGFLATIDMQHATPFQSASATIVVDGVGRGGVGGDLLVGAADATLVSAAGVARFDIEVGDNSRLQTIASTGNALSEVYFHNGTTSGHRDGNPDFVRDQGSIDVTGAGGQGAGLRDVRVIDASAMLGNVHLRAEVTEPALAKYGAGTAAGVPGYVLAGGAGNDKLHVTIDRGVFAAPTATSGLPDLRFQIAGGAGNDVIEVVLSGAAARQEGQLRITGGAGNDRIVLDADAASPSRDLLLYAGQFGQDVVSNFNVAHDKLAFSSLGTAIGPPGTAVSLAHKSVTVAAQTSANDSVAEIAALYAGAAAGIHVFVAYDASNVGTVYAVQHGSDGAFAATLVGSIDLQQTGWATLGTANFI